MDGEALHMNFALPVAIDSERLDWTASPLPGVWRRRLEREDAESGRATSIVRYEPGCAFRPHTHVGGEEYFVLEGVFSDQDGDFGPGSYVRNPPGTSHAPRSDGGCTIFVKLCQMQQLGEDRLHVDTQAADWRPGVVAGHRLMPLYTGQGEEVALECLDAGTVLDRQEAGGGEEILVLEGDLETDGRSHGPRTWLRRPPGGGETLSSANGCTYWVKRGHLRGL